MKTTKLSKNFAALCLSVAAFCATQGAFAEVVVPEWQNSFTTAPASTDQFYLYHTSGKFATNSADLVEAKDVKDQTWQNDGGKLKVNDVYFNAKQKGTLSYTYNPDFVASNGTALKYGYSNDAWAISASLQPRPLASNKDHFLHGSDGKLSINTTAGNEWYFVSSVQYNNHMAIVAAKNGEVYAEANQLLETAEEGAPKTALEEAVNTAETAINGVGVEDPAGVTTVSAAITELNNAISIYKQSGLGQYVEALQATLEDAASYDGPDFGFLVSKLSAANTAMNANPQVADALDDANTELVAALELARTILADEAYTNYLANIEQIEAKSENTGEYTGYATELMGIISEAKVDLLEIENVAGLISINNGLKATISNFEFNLHLYAVAEDVVGQAAVVGYDEEAGLAAVKAAASTGLRDLMDGIRDAAKAGIDDFIANYESEDPIDMTIFINNNSFELGDATGWTFTEDMNDTQTKVWDNTVITPPTENTDGGYLYNTYYETKVAVFFDVKAGRPISQTISGLPKGKYRLEALLSSGSDNSVCLTIDGEQIAESSVSTSNETVFKNSSCEFYVDNTEITIGASGKERGIEAINVTYNPWFRADNFRLTLLSTATVLKDTDVAYKYEEGTLPEVRVKREIKGGQWTTLCLPMECDKPASLTLYEVSDETQDGEHVSIAVTPSSDEKILAGKPYIVKNKENNPGVVLGWGAENYDISQFSAKNVTLLESPSSAGDYVPFVGLFEPTDLNAGDIYVSTDTNNGSGDAPVYKELSAEATNKQMKGFRAYFKMTDGASSNVRFITDEVITNIMQAIEEQQVANGTYDLSGRKAATLQKGTYVIDGKKVIIK